MRLRLGRRTRGRASALPAVGTAWRPPGRSQWGRARQRQQTQGHGPGDEAGLQEGTRSQLLSFFVERGVERAVTGGPGTQRKLSVWQRPDGHQPHRPGPVPS